MISQKFLIKISKLHQTTNNLFLWTLRVDCPRRSASIHSISRWSRSEEIRLFRDRLGSALTVTLKKTKTRPEQTRLHQKQKKKKIPNITNGFLLFASYTWKSHSCRTIFPPWRNICPLRGRDSRSSGHSRHATSSPGHSAGTCPGWACRSPRTLSAFLLLARTVLKKKKKQITKSKIDSHKRINECRIGRNLSNSIFNLLCGRFYKRFVIVKIGAGVGKNNNKKKSF